MIKYSPEQKQVGKAVFRVALTLRTFVQTEAPDDDYLTKSEASCLFFLCFTYFGVMDWLSQDVFEFACSVQIQCISASQWQVCTEHCS